MDARGNIYSDDPDKIPAEDKARLEGYLLGREEAHVLDVVKQAAYEAKVREMESFADLEKRSRSIKETT